MAVQHRVHWTPEEYLELERKAEHKSEYWAGEIFAMAGANRRHNLIVGNVIGELRDKLRPTGCEVYPSDMKVRVSATGLYTYPDVTVVCEAPEFEDGHEDVLLNPILIVEVLSPSTEAYNRGDKFAQYRRLPSLRAFLLLSQERALAELYTRQSDNTWLLQEISELDGIIPIDAVPCAIPLSGLYNKVNFEESADRREESANR